MKNLNVVNLTPAHRFGADFADVADQAFDELKSKERVADIKGASKNTRPKRKESGVSIRADLRESALSLDEIKASYGKENSKRATRIRNLEKQIRERNEKNISAFVSLGKEFRAYQIQAEYFKDGETKRNESLFDSLIKEHDLERFTRGERRAYIVVYQRETELDALEAWRVSTAKKRIKPLHELDADSIRKAFDAYDKAQQSASDSESDTESDTNSKSDTLDKIVKNALVRADKLGIEKAELIRAIQSAQI